MRAAASDYCPVEGRPSGTPHRDCENPNKEKTDLDMSRSLCSDLNSDRLIMNTLFQEQTAAIQPLALRPKDAATALGIFEGLTYESASFFRLPNRQNNRRFESATALMSHLPLDSTQERERPVGIGRRHRHLTPEGHPFETDAAVAQQEIHAGNGGAE